MVKEMQPERAEKPKAVPGGGRRNLLGPGSGASITTATKDVSCAETEHLIEVVVD